MNHFNKPTKNDSAADSINVTA